MKKYITGLGVIGISLCMLIAQAQKPQQKQKKVTFKGKSYLYGGTISSGTISKKLFDSLIAYPLVAKDSSNTERPVMRFEFSYSERGVYEDSTGKLRIMTDHYNTESKEGKLPADWISSIRGRSKRGDTVVFFDILASFTDSLRTRFYSEPIKLIITD